MIQRSLRCYQFDLDTIRIFEEDAVTSAGKGVFVQIEDVRSALLELHDQFVYMLSRTGMKCEMIKTGAATVVWHIKKSFLGLNQYDIGLTQDPATALVPRLVNSIPQFVEQPAPELDGSGEIGDVNLDMMKQAGRHWEKV